MQKRIYIYKITLFVLYFLFLTSYLFAQPNRDKYRDQKWIFGYYSTAHHPDFGGSVLDFSTNTPNAYFQYTDMNFEDACTSLCDTAGNLIMYSNGIYIADKTHQKMINGDSLDYGQLWEQHQTEGHYLQQGFVTTIPIGCKGNCAAMLYINSPPVIGVGGIGGINVAYIDFKRNNGKGLVTQKDIPIFSSDTLASVFGTFCRHANGRDWWYVATKSGQSKYYRFLFTPYGIMGQGVQTMPVLPKKGGVLARYSPDGTKYAQHYPEVGTYLYDFDRCTGLLSNRQLIPLHRNFRTLFCGIEFSPNSRYLYATDDSRIVQYDTQSPNISASGIVVAQYDGFQDGGFGNTSFYLLQLAPNGKIYGNCTGGNHYLHVIHSPDERGLACNVVQHDFRLPTFYYSTMPNFPYFRLGSEPGTICDSLGIETGVTATSSNPYKGGETIEMHVSPNPTNGECVLSVMSTDGGQRGRIRLLSLDGKVLETFYNPFLNQNNLNINLKNYAKGVYIAEYITQDGGSIREKIVRQ